MAYSTSLGVLLPDQGSLTGTWGTALNNQVFALFDSAIAGRVVIGASGSTWTDANPSIHSLTATEGAINEARAAIIHLVTYNNLPAASSSATLVIPDKSKAYIINNSLTDTRNIVKVCTASGASAGNSVFVPKGAVAEVYCDGAGKVTSAQNFIVDGVIENTTIGATTPSTGKFTTLEATGAATLVAGTINATTIGASTPSTGKFTTLEATGAATLVAGTINATTIGASTPSTGAFTTLVATTIGVASQGSGKFTTLEATGAATLVAGTINATTIGASTPSTGAFTTLVATTIGVASQGSGKFTTLEASGNIKSTAGTGQFYGAALSSFSDSNTVIGRSAAPTNWTTAAVDTVIIGKGAAEDLTTGSSNVFLGVNAGINATTGQGNVFIGKNAGGFSDSSSSTGITTGADNIVIGPLAGFRVAAATSRSVLLGFVSSTDDLSDTVLIATGTLSSSTERLKIDVTGCNINSIPVTGKVGLRVSTKDSTQISNQSAMVQGELVYNTTTNRVMYYTGSAWLNT
jgi:hypothetical protein